MTDTAVAAPVAAAPVRAPAPEGTLRVRKFNIRSLKTDRRVLIVGKPGTGKSTLLKCLCYYVADRFDAALAMSPTQDSIDMFREFLPDSCIYEEFDGGKIQEIIKVLRTLNFQHKYPRVAIFLDDCMADKKNLNSKAIRDIHMNGRHLRMLFVNIVQYMMDVNCALRGQVDYVFAMRESSLNARLNLYKNFFGVFDTFQDFCTVLDACTENNECLVLDNTARTNRVEDMVFWYTARVDHPRYLLGSRPFWRLHYMFYKPQQMQFDDTCPIPALAAPAPAAAEDAVPVVAAAAAPAPAPSASRKRTKRKTSHGDLTLEIEKTDVHGNALRLQAPPPPPQHPAPLYQAAPSIVARR